VLNLICNAIRHTAAGGTIEVSTKGYDAAKRLRAAG
jgi:signal transduction histidine kinase